MCVAPSIFKSKKAILTPEQVGLLLKVAVEDKQKGIYYAFPFLTGVRPSEQLGLLWEDVVRSRPVSTSGGCAAFRRRNWHSRRSCTGPISAASSGEFATRP